MKEVPVEVFAEDPGRFVYYGITKEIITLIAQVAFFILLAFVAYLLLKQPP